MNISRAALLCLGTLAFSHDISANPNNVIEVPTLAGDVVIDGVPDEDFTKRRGVYTDAQIFKETMTFCFFNLFFCFVEATNLPVEDWFLNDKSPKMGASINKPVAQMARVALVSDVGQILPGLFLLGFAIHATRVAFIEVRLVLPLNRDDSAGRGVDQVAGALLCQARTAARLALA